MSKILQKASSETSGEIDLNKRPNIRLLYTIPPELTLCRKSHDVWMSGMKKALPLDAFGEGSEQIFTSLPNQKGETASLHLLSTGNQQKPHIHIPPTIAGHADTSSFKNATSNRFLYIVTAAKEGKVEWFMPDGKMEVAQDADGHPFAKGSASKNALYTMTIPPYSAALVEMQGGVHNFTNIAAYSYHMQNAPNGEPQKSDDLVRNTFEWRGDRPAEVIELKPAGVDMKVTGLSQITDANNLIYGQLERFAKLGAHARLPSCMMASIIYGVFGHDNPLAAKFDWVGNGGACAPDESPERINAGFGRTSRFR